MDQDLCARVADIRRRLDAAALARWGRAPEIIAVSKTVSAPRVNEVKAAGIARLGENRVQETLEKLPYLDAAFQIDLIGRLQINKVKYIIDKVAMIQSLDREPLAQEIDRRAQQHGLRMPVLIQHWKRAAEGRRCRRESAFVHAIRRQTAGTRRARLDGRDAGLA